MKQLVLLVVLFALVAMMPPVIAMEMSTTSTVGFSPNPPVPISPRVSLVPEPTTADSLSFADSVTTPPYVTSENNTIVDFDVAKGESIVQTVTATNNDVPLYSQRDPTWRDDRLGYASNPDPGTIGGYGCALTSTAMVFKYYGVDVNPKTLNNWLIANSGYTNYDLINWDRSVDFSDNIHSVEKIPYEGKLADLNKINSELNAGCPVIANVNLDAPTADGGTHFVVITGYESNNIYILNDPWDGQVHRLNENRYATKYNPSNSIYDPANRIWNIRVYSGEKLATLNPPSPVYPGVVSERGITIDTLTPTFQWEASQGGADYYSIYVSEDPYGSSSLVVGESPIYGTSWTVPSGILVSGEKYRWNMQAHKAGQASEFSYRLYFQTKAASPPNTPSAPSGPTSGTYGVPYSYSTSATDSDGDQVKYTFDWGDSQTSETNFVGSGSTAIASHSWSTAGTYAVKAKATDSNGGSSGWSGTLTVKIESENNPPNTPSSPYGEITGELGTLYAYVTSTTDPNGDQVKYIFDWDDGQMSETNFVSSGSTAIASHSWSNSGSYLVKAKATDSKGRSSGWSSARTVTIEAANTNTPPNMPSTPYGETTGEPGTLYAYVTSATDPNGDQVKYAFDWGDGQTSETNFVSSGSTAIASHSWSTAGTYAVKAKTSDSNGGSSGWSGTLTVKIEPENNPPNTPSTPYGEITGEPGTLYAYVTSATDPNGDQIKYAFDWGDGQTSETNFVNSGSTVIASHSWSNLGSYLVKAKATDSNDGSSGWSGTLTVKIEATTGMDANFTANITSGPAPLAVQFTDTSTGNPTAWSWTFGDGAISTEQHPVHTYAVPGTYTVSLTVTNSAGSNTTTQTDCITVVPASGQDIFWEVPLSVTSGTFSQTVTLGSAESATREFDAGLDVPMPPDAPGAKKSVYFTSTDPTFGELSTDYKPPIDDANPEESWTLCIRSDEPVQVTWDTTLLAGSELFLTWNNETNTIAMKATNATTLPAGSYSISISASTAQQIDLPLQVGWNLVSVPFSDAEYTVPQNSILAIYGYNPSTKGYETVSRIESLVPGRAYWVASGRDCTVVMAGTPVSPVTAHLKQGWNLIGSTAGQSAFDSIAITPTGSWAMPFVYGYDPRTKGYGQSTELQPGEGYWGAVTRDCTITLP